VLHQLAIVTSCPSLSKSIGLTPANTRLARRIPHVGNITLQSGGHYNAGTLASLNDALNLIGIRVTCPR
jgi:hypothetical protein